MKTINLIARDANDLVTTIATETAKDMEAAIKVAKRLSGGRKVGSKGADTFVTGKHGTAWIA